MSGTLESSGKVVRLADFRAGREPRPDAGMLVEPREPRRPLAASQVAHRFVLLAHLRLCKGRLEAAH